jgi:hypothetical protein
MNTTDVKGGDLELFGGTILLKGLMKTKRSLSKDRR